MPHGAGIAYLQALTNEHSKARECVAALRCYDAFQRLNIRRSALWNTLGSAASERIVMTLARVLDDDSQTITATSFCRCLEQHPEECLFAFSEAGREKYPDAARSVRLLTKKWLVHWNGHPLHGRIKHARDKSIAHLDKKQWLTAEDLGEIRIRDVEDLLDDLLQMINDFQLLMENGQTADLVFPVVSFEGALSIAAYEAGFNAVARGVIDQAKFEERVDEIRNAIEAED